MEYLKTVNVTNNKNVLVQVPAFIARQWGLDIGDKLEVHYDSEEQYIKVKPLREDVQRRGDAAQ